MDIKGLHIIKMSYENYTKLQDSELIPNAIYLLDNGMMFAQGEKYGNDIQVVDTFPVSPIPQIIYMNAHTLEQKMWMNGSWYTLQNDFQRLTNSQIDKMFQDDF